MIYLEEVRSISHELLPEDSYLNNLGFVSNFKPMKFKKMITFFTGENGTGKSTLLEALALCLKFNPEGGSKNFNFSTRDTHSELADALRIFKSPYHPKDGFFFHAEHGDGSFCRRGKPESAAADCRHQIISADEIAESIMITEIPESLKIGNRMVKSGTVQAAVQQKPAAAHGKSPAHCQHGIRIILFHREHIGPVRRIAQGIKVPQDHIRLQSQRLGMPETAVRRNHSLVGSDGLHQSGKFRCTEDMAGFHQFHLPRICTAMVSYFPGKRNKKFRIPIEIRNFYSFL